MILMDLEKTAVNSLKKPKMIGIRHLQFCLLFFGLIISFIIRSSFSVGILAMTSKTPPNPSIPTYPEWTNRDLMLSSFFWGYIIFQIGAGQLGERFGPKWILFSAYLLTGVLNIMVPFIAANTGSTGVMVIRFLQGTALGTLFPSTNILISKWAPIIERSKVVSTIYGSASIGIIVGMLVTGVISDSSWGWTWLFYLFGIITILWAVLWAIFGGNDPTEYPWISKDEKEFIKANTATIAKKATPWKSIFTSMPVWAIAVASAVYCWISTTLLTNTPTYLQEIMNFNIKANGYLSALPYALAWLFSLLLGVFVDWFLVKKWFTTGTTRKIFQCSGFILSGASVLWLGFLESTQQTLAVTLLVLEHVLIILSLGGYFANHIDLSPNYAGTLTGFTNTIGHTSACLASLSIGWYSYEKIDPVLWRFVFSVTAGINVFGAVFYGVFAKGETQSWNYDID